MSELSNAVQGLAVVRRRAAESSTTLRTLRERFDAQHADLIALVKSDAAEVAALEAQVRELGVAHYAEHQNKHPAPGVEIAVGTEFEVDEAAALAWAIKTEMCLIPASVDLKGIRTIAKVQSLPFVTPVPKATVRIATDLDKALAVAGIVEPAAGAVAS